MDKWLRRFGKALKLLKCRDYRRGLSVGIGASVEFESFLQHQDFATLLDVGANKGQFALAARHARPNARILSFEPVKASADRYRALFNGAANLELFQVAAGSAPGELAIRVPSDNSQASFYVPIAGTDETVRVERLDDLIPAGTLKSPILMKMDLQGYELEALKGAERLLAEVDHLLIEIGFWRVAPGVPLAHEIIAWLRERSFDLAGIYNGHELAGVSFSADAHFERRKAEPAPSAQVA